MKLAILSCSINAYSTRRLKEAAEQRGHTAKVLNTLKFAIDLDRGNPVRLIPRRLVAEDLRDAIEERLPQSNTTQ